MVLICILAFEKTNLDLLVSIQYDLKKMNNRLFNMEKRILSLSPADGVVVGGGSAAPSLFLQWNYLPIRVDDDIMVLEEKLREKDCLESLV